MSFVVKNAPGSRCSLAYCTSLWSNNNEELRISFFKFPKDHSRCASWVEKCEAKYLPTTDLDILHKTFKLCSLHFEDDMFLNTLKNRLKQTAIPTLFAKKPAEFQSNSLVGSKNISILNQSTESSSMTDDICSIDDQPSCSTPYSVTSTYPGSIFGGGGGGQLYVAFWKMY
ncbi:THAP domain-containing protein 5-like [Aphis gossypii]|uniref:THAP domain-containing protein 5-like n=1 Tax=Aphis gossypii TaxID=80765 RepID=UPI0021592F7E|nr:THAP domain-containing protein 5-like [Aphis gossypii]